MGIAKCGLIAGLIFIGNAITANANDWRTLTGAVITTEGKMMQEFTVAAKPLANKPGLGVRRRFKDGIFRLEGLPARKYEIVIEAPLHIRTRMHIDLRERPDSQSFRLIMLYPFRNEARYLADSHSVSVSTLQQNIPEKAIRAYEEAVMFHREGRLEEAMRAYGRAIQVYPQYPQALADVGALYILLNDMNTGLRYLHRALTIDRDNSILRINMAIAHTAMGEFDKASKILQKVLQKERRKSWPRYVLARTFFHQRQYDEAKATVRLALNEDPRLLDAWLLLLNLAIELKDGLTAREALLEIRTLVESADFDSFIDGQIQAMVLK